VVGQVALSDVTVTATFHYANHLNIVNNLTIAKTTMRPNFTRTTSCSIHLKSRERVISLTWTRPLVQSNFAVTKPGLFNPETAARTDIPAPARI